MNNGTMSLSISEIGDANSNDPNQGDKDLENTKSIMDKNIDNVLQFMADKNVGFEIRKYIEYILELVRNESSFIKMKHENEMKNIELTKNELKEIKYKYDSSKKIEKEWKRQAEDLKVKYSCFEENLLQFKDNPSELIWEYKKSLSENRQLTQELEITQRKLHETEAYYKERKNSMVESDLLDQIRGQSNNKNTHVDLNSLQQNSDVFRTQQIQQDPLLGFKNSNANSDISPVKTRNLGSSNINYDRKINQRTQDILNTDGVVQDIEGEEEKELDKVKLYHPLIYRRKRS